MTDSTENKAPAADPSASEPAAEAKATRSRRSVEDAATFLKSPPRDDDVNLEGFYKNRDGDVVRLPACSRDIPQYERRGLKFLGWAPA